jgi:hypothetical protein
MCIEVSVRNSMEVANIGILLQVEIIQLILKQWTIMQGCQMVYCQTKNPNFGKF